ncbi:alanine racemase [Amnibacterium kyonggiense]|uniref:D-serine deaminase-like pyridoxal phosphate-dependent protein n=1 Tax=Amnibacterium kyonggiense TaxID=595671 RepID=A0A4R7FRU1_9MICO|nr:alanine racemase [Amnibacterium kyonggiense]TDS80476.1 D-serine deaminase-like pyridoxal phosphate-dependent protein [Amnibacterium kyonggiense]
MIALPPPTATPWTDPTRFWPGVLEATAGLDAPLGVLELDALAWNAHDLVRRAKGTPIRLASKSLRVREAIESVLALPGWHGVLAYSLPEALRLVAAGIDDVVLGYPVVDRAALAALAADEEAAARITLMIDAVAQLDLVDAAVAPASRPPLRVALDLDMSIDLPVLGHLGVRRSPLRDAAAAIALGRHVAARPGFRLVGLMGYEAQMAGVVDRYGANRAYERIIAGVKRRSAEVAFARREAAVAGLRQLTDLEFVNGGGTGSIEATIGDSSVTEVTAGSGLFGGHLFDRYRTFRPAPAASFVLSVVRVPSAGVATLEGGGWIASGPVGPDRRPLPVWPRGLDYEPREQAGEVQTPVRGGRLAVGDRVVLRHTKSGEPAERLAAYRLVRSGALVGEWPTYRGEGATYS